MAKKVKKKIKFKIVPILIFLICLVIAVKKKEDTHRMAEANKAFAHYRW